MATFCSAVPPEDPGLFDGVPQVRPPDPMESPGAKVGASPPPDGFWNHPFVQSVAPFLTSLTLHVGILVMGLAAARIVQKVIVPQVRAPVQEVYTDILPDQPESAIKGFWAPTDGDASRPFFQDKFPDAPKDAKGFASKPGTDLIPKLVGGGSGQAESSMLSLGPSTGLGIGAGLGTGIGDGVGSGRGNGEGVLAPFGVPGGGSPTAGFFSRNPDQRSYARKVAYVCDASGSMLDMFDGLRGEIRKSVDNLRPTQAFNVVFFQNESFLAVERSALLPANPETKKRCVDFLEKVVPRGTTDPLPALEAVARMEPELIFLLTDGDFSGPGNDKVVEFCKRRFADGRTKITTIAYISKDSKDNPQDMEFVKALQAIAKSTGGDMRFASEEDMGK